LPFKIEENKISWLQAENEVGFVTFVEVQNQPKVVEINHTFVDDCMRGQGLAGKLMQKTAEVLKEKQLTAILTCSYAVKWFNEHPEYADVVAQEK
jgi:predicted GNAT family acetyltransferase